MSEVDIFDRTKRPEDLVDTYTVDPKTGKATPDKLSTPKRKKRPRRRRRGY